MTTKNSSLILSAAIAATCFIPARAQTEKTAEREKAIKESLGKTGKAIGKKIAKEMKSQRAVYYVVYAGETSIKAGLFVSAAEKAFFDLTLGWSTASSAGEAEGGGRAAPRSKCDPVKSKDAADQAKCGPNQAKEKAGAGKDAGKPATGSHGKVFLGRVTEDGSYAGVVSAGEGLSIHWGATVIKGEIIKKDLRVTSKDGKKLKLVASNFKAEKAAKGKAEKAAQMAKSLDAIQEEAPEDTDD